MILLAPSRARRGLACSKACVSHNRLVCVYRMPTSDRLLTLSCQRVLWRPASAFITVDSRVPTSDSYFQSNNGRLWLFLPFLIPRGLFFWGLRDHVDSCCNDLQSKRFAVSPQIVSNPIMASPLYICWIVHCNICLLSMLPHLDNAWNDRFC